MVPRRTEKLGAWNTVRNYIERTLEMINLPEIAVKYAEKLLHQLRLEMQTNILRNKRNIRKDT